MSRQTIQPDKHYIIDYPATVKAAAVKENDLLSRLAHGLNLAKSDGFNICFVIENDDYYPDDYLEKMYNAFIESGKDMIGIGKTYCYHLFRARYNVYDHPLRSALFCTGFKISKVLPYMRPSVKVIKHNFQVDLYLFSIIELSREIIVNDLFKFPEDSPIGIKHGIGRCFTRAHTETDNYLLDEQSEQLQHIRKESQDFYKELKLDYIEYA